MKLLHRFFLITILSLFALPVTYSQGITFDWGNNVDTKKFILKILGETEHGHYALARKNRDFFLEYYVGKGMDLKFSNKLEIKQEDGLKTTFAEIYYLEENLVMFTAAYDKENKQYRIYAYNLTNTGKIASERVDIMYADVERKGRRGTFDIRLSRDRSKLLVMHSSYHKKR